MRPEINGAPRRPAWRSTAPWNPRRANLNGSIAATVNGAQKGMLIGTGTGGNLSISSVGSQTIVSSSVVATNSTVTSPINATQTSSNTGDVSTTGTITVK